MASLLKNTSVREIAAGLLVSRATKALPASTSGNIFTVTGGRILVVSVIGQVTTVIGSTAMTLSMGTTPTTGSANATSLGTAVSGQASAPVGTHYASNPGGALLADQANGAGVAVSSTLFLVDIGSITITTSATNTGSVKWDLLYIPLDPGVVVTAA